MRAEGAGGAASALSQSGLGKGRGTPPVAHAAVSSASMTPIPGRQSLIPAPGSIVLVQLSARSAQRYSGHKPNSLRALAAFGHLTACGPSVENLMTEARRLTVKGQNTAG